MLKSTYKKVIAGLALFTVELLLVWAMFIACILVFLYLSSEIRAGDEVGMDEAAFQFAHNISSPGLSRFIEVITFFASRQFLTPAALILIAYFLFIRKHKWYSLKVPVVALGSISLNIIMKFFFDRDRPAAPLVEASGLSFPSGHSMVAASFYGLFIYLVWKHVKNPALRYTLVALLILFIILIGFSRIYLRVHYATDVAAGFAAGFVWVIIGLWTLRRLEKLSKKELNPVVLEEPTETPS